MADLKPFVCTTMDLIKAFPELTRDLVNTAYRSNVIHPDFNPPASAGRLGRHLSRYEAAALVLGIRFTRKGVKPDNAARIAYEYVPTILRTSAKSTPAVLILNDEGGVEVLTKAQLATMTLEQLFAYKGGMPLLIRVSDIVETLDGIAPREKSSGWVGPNQKAYVAAVRRFREQEERAKNIEDTLGRHRKVASQAKKRVDEAV